MATDGETPPTTEEGQVCVFLWSPPRCASTAMAKCMSFVEGVQVWHEPYLYSFLNEVNMSGHLENLGPVLEKTPRGKRIDNCFFKYPWVKSQLESQDPDVKLIFVKDMAHVMNGKFDQLPTSRKFRHTFLIRDPRRMYRSFRKMMEAAATVESTGDAMSNVQVIYKHTYDLWQYTKQNLDPEAIIIDGTELVSQPEKLLPKYFRAIGVPYKEDYLRWDPSPDVITEWKASFGALVGSYLGDVIKRAVDSSHFIPEGPPPSRDNLPADVIKCVDAAQPYYDLMYEQRIRP